MKRCVINADPAALRVLFGLPEGCLIDGIGYSDQLGVIQLRIEGFGSEVAEGHRLPSAEVIVEHREFNGEVWFRAAARMHT